MEMASVRQHTMDQPGTELLAHEIPQLSSTFPAKQFDVTDIFFRLFCCGKQELFLEPEEVFFHQSGCCVNDKKRMPYGELQNVEQTNCCGCCHSFGGGSGLAPADKPLAPGCCGCGHEKLVSDIVGELKLRMRQRGDTAQIRRQEEMGKKMDLVLAGLARIESKLDAPGQQRIGG